MHPANIPLKENLGIGFRIGLRVNRPRARDGVCLVIGFDDNLQRAGERAFDNDFATDFEASLAGIQIELT